MNLRRGLITMLVLFLPLESILDVSQAGFSYSQDLTHHTVSVSAGTHPGLILWALAALFLFFGILRREEPIRNLQAPSMKRRVWAFCLDFIFYIGAVAPLLALIPLFLEAHRLGHFEWEFARDYSVPLDWLAWPLVLVMMLGMVPYFAYPLTRGKATAGSYLLRLLVVEKGKPVSLSWPSAMKRVGWEFLGFGLWPYTLFKGKDSEGKTWYDRKSGLQVMRYEKDAKAEREFHLVWYFVFAFVACGLAYGYNKYFSQDDTKPHWRTYSYGDYQFSLESPVYLPVDKPAYEVRQLDQDTSKGLAINEGNGGLQVAVESYEYKYKIVPGFPGKFCANFDKASRDDVRVQDFKPMTQAVTLSGLPGKEMSGTYLWKGDPVGFSMVVVTDGEWVWTLKAQGLETPGLEGDLKRIEGSFQIQK